MSVDDFLFTGLLAILYTKDTNYLFLFGKSFSFLY